jgi:hypothetical protein
MKSDRVRVRSPMYNPGAYESGFFRRNEEAFACAALFLAFGGFFYGMNSSADYFTSEDRRATFSEAYSEDLTWNDSLRRYSLLRPAHTQVCRPRAEGGDFGDWTPQEEVPDSLGRNGWEIYNEMPDANGFQFLNNFLEPIETSSGIELKLEDEFENQPLVYRVPPDYFRFSDIEEIDKQLINGMLREYIVIMAETVKELERFPSEFLKTLKLDTVEFAQSSDWTGGVYRSSEESIGIKLKQPEKLTAYAQIIIVHELAHAIHEYICGGNYEHDLELADGIEFFDVPEGMRPRGYLAERVPDYQVDYGPGRVYPEYYGAHSVYEYFAMIVEFTLVHRGIIMPGDEDYGSVLQKKQYEIIDRIEENFKGFKEFAEFRTAALRLDPKNEIHRNIDTITVTQLEMDEMIKAEQDQIGLNGVVIENAESPLHAWPKIIIGSGAVYPGNNDEEAHQVLEYQVHGWSESSFSVMSRVDNVVGTMYVLKKQGEDILTEVGGFSLEEYGISIGGEMFKPENVVLLSRLIDEGVLELVELRIVGNPPVEELGEGVDDSQTTDSEVTPSIENYGDYEGEYSSTEMSDWAEEIHHTDSFILEHGAGE